MTIRELLYRLDVRIDKRGWSIGPYFGKKAIYLDLGPVAIRWQR